MIDLDRAIGDYRAAGKTRFHAIADNFGFEERLSPARLAAYEAHPARPGAAPFADPFAEHHAAYLRRRIEGSEAPLPAAPSLSASLSAVP